MGKIKRQKYPYFGFIKCILYTLQFEMHFQIWKYISEFCIVECIFRFKNIFLIIQNAYFILYYEIH